MKKSQAFEPELRCSFCHKLQEAVEKLISSPSDYPRAYICDECVFVCAMILEDMRGESGPGAGEAAPGERAHRLLAHPLASPLIAAVERWMRSESQGVDAAGDLAQVRRIARQMMS